MPWEQPYQERPVAVNQGEIEGGVVGGMGERRAPTSWIMLRLVELLLIPRFAGARARDTWYSVRSYEGKLRSHVNLLPGSKMLKAMLAACTLVLLLSSCQSTGRGSSFTPEDRARFDEYWQHYHLSEADWPEYREKWLAEGEKSAAVLIQSVMVDYVESFDENDLLRHDRARTELVELFPASIPFLAEGLIPAQDIVRKQFSEVLVHAGARAVTPLSKKIDHSDPEVRRIVIVTLRKIGHPSAAPLLEKRAKAEKVWRVRAEIPGALIATMGAEAGPSLARMLRDDPDAFVRRRAARVLGGIGSDLFVEDLIKALRRAERELTQIPAAGGNSEGVTDFEDLLVSLHAEINDLCDALEDLTGRGYGKNAKRWLSWWEGRP